VKTVEESAGICGYDAHKHVKGRKRHLLVDTLGIPLSIYVTPADTHDTTGARCLLAGLTFFVPRLKKIWADAAYRGQELAEWCRAEGAGIWREWNALREHAVSLFSRRLVGSGADIWMAFPQ